MAKQWRAQEVILGASNSMPPTMQLDQIALYWMNLSGGEEAR